MKIAGYFKKPSRVGWAKAKRCPPDSSQALNCKIHNNRTYAVEIDNLIISII